MSGSFELDPVTRLTAGAVGEPGNRTFYIQARSADQLVTLHAEKEQVRALAESIVSMLEALPVTEDEPTVATDDLELEEPLLPEWRIGPMALRYDESRDRILVIASELLEEEEAETEREAATATFVASRAQARALAEHAEEVVEAGRPRCRFCGFPLDPDGHACPAMNGHRES
ncbi:MAG: DUF3090 family protein [Actinomycetota bacterium]